MKSKTAGFLKSGIVLCLLFLLTAAFTFPLVFRMGSGVAGISSDTESLDVIWYFWWLKYARTNQISADFCPLSAAPFGIDLSKLPNYPVLSWISGWIAYFANEIFAYNLWIMLSFLIGAAAMYGLVHDFTGSRMAGLVSAVIFAFCPYHFARVWQHLGLANIQWMPLFVWALLKMELKKEYRYAVFAAGAYALVAYFDYYYAFFMGVVVVALAVFKVFFRWKDKIAALLKRRAGTRYSFIDGRAIKVYLLAAVLSLVLILPAAYPLFKTSRQIMSGQQMSAEYKTRFFAHSLEELFAGSARPLSYFLPAAQHPFFGKITGYFIGSPYYGQSFTEHALYLGWVPLVLAFVAVREWIRLRRLKIEDRESKQDFALGFFVFLSIAAWLSSQPPWWRIGPLKIYMPSFFMFKLLPMFRAYCRFGIVVMLALSVLAGYGMKCLLDRFNSHKSRAAVALLVCGLVLFEFLNFPPFKFLDLSRVPAAYVWIKEQPGNFAIAEFPLDFNGANSAYRYFQTKHGKQTINGTLQGTVANQFSRAILQVPERKTPGHLAWMKVRYVLIHCADYRRKETSGAAAELKTLRTVRGLKFIKAFGDTEIYEVTALPLKPDIELDDFLAHTAG